MAWATKDKKKAKQEDLRKPNFQPNNMPEHLVLTVFVDGEIVDDLEIPQNPKLSEAGNITYKGGIAGGWPLEGDPTHALNSITIVMADGTTLKTSEEAAHDSKAGNPTIFHGAPIEIRRFDGVVTKHRISVWTTQGADGTYGLKATTMPAAVGRPRGPQVVGRAGAGFGLIPRVSAAAVAAAEAAAVNA